MKRTTNFQPHSVIREDRTDGAIILRSTHELGTAAKCSGEWLHRWAEETPDHLFLAERSGDAWRKECYLSALQKVRALAGGLLGRGLDRHTPIVVLSGNGIDHGLLSLAAQYVGVPVVPLAEQYSMIPEAHGRLVEAVEMVKPKLAYVIDAERYGAALALDVLSDIEVIASRPGGTSVSSFDELLKGDHLVDVDSAHSAVGPETVAKILLTSGSTSSPKGVLTTQRMLCVNQVQVADSLPFLRQRPPRIVDWLPWNHVFGGSHNFNLVIANGGSLYIDDGKPISGVFDRTLENLSMATGTLMFNVPIGYAMLLGELQKDRDLRRRIFENLDLIFYSGASLPQDIWQALEGMAMDIKGEVPLMTSSWGMTETAPAALIQQEPISRSGVIGVPMTGVTVKLIPDADMRCEIRVLGPNVTPGYFNDPDRTRESFDDEGFLITGDAMAFVDPSDANKGLRFDGRLSEDFKLSTGTWVRGAKLKTDVLSSFAPLASEVVITGHDRSEIGVLIFPSTEAAAQAGYSDESDDGALICTRLLDEVRRRLVERVRDQPGSSSRVCRALVLADPPSLGEGEMTAKGSLNWRKILTRRAHLVERLYDDTDVAVAQI